MKKLFFFLTFLFPLATFATPFYVSIHAPIRMPIDGLMCPSIYRDIDNGACGGINAELHNQFVQAMKKYDSQKAINIWNQMSNLANESDRDIPANRIMEPLFGFRNPPLTPPIPEVILIKKAYKGGILTLGKEYHQDFMMNYYSEYYISYMRYKTTTGLFTSDLVIYNTPLVPYGSRQYNTYTKLYGDSVFEFERDIIAALNRGKFNNKDANNVYQNFVGSIKDIPGYINISQVSVTKDRTISEKYRVKNGKVQFASYSQQTGGYVWGETEFDPKTIVILSPENGYDKYGAFYRNYRINLNGKNTFVYPIGATSTSSSRFWTDRITDTVYVFNSETIYGGKLNIERLPGAKADTIIVTLEKDNQGNYIHNDENLLHICKNGDTEGKTSWTIKAIDSEYCYGTIGSNEWNQIQNLTERIR